MYNSFLPVPGDLVDLIPGGGMWTLDGYTFSSFQDFPAARNKMLVVSTIKAHQLFGRDEQPKDVNPWVIVFTVGNLYMVMSSSVGVVSRVAPSSSPHRAKLYGSDS